MRKFHMETTEAGPYERSADVAEDESVSDAVDAELHNDHDLAIEHQDGTAGTKRTNNSPTIPIRNAIIPLTNDTDDNIQPKHFTRTCSSQRDPQKPPQARLVASARGA